MRGFPRSKVAMTPDDRMCPHLEVVSATIHPWRPDDGIPPFGGWFVIFLMACAPLKGSRLYTPRWDVPLRKSVNADTSVTIHPWHPDYGIFPTRRLIHELLLMGCAPLGRSCLYTLIRDVPPPGSVNVDTDIHPYTCPQWWDSWPKGLSLYFWWWLTYVIIVLMILCLLSFRY